MNPYNYKSPGVLEEVKDLISYSITKHNRRDPDYKSMHCAILQQYFEARNVKINYDEQTVDMEIPVGEKQYTSISFECQELGRFLKSCLKKDEKSLYFYQNLLLRYNAVTAA